VRGTAFIGGLLIAGLGLALSRDAARIPSGPEDAHPDAPHAIADPPALFQRSKEPPSRATRYVSMSTEECLAELDARHVDYTRVHRTDIETPVRLNGPLSGVPFHTLLPKKERERSPYEIFDCRLVLALDDFAKILLRHDIVDVMQYSAFRPLVPGVVKRGHERALAIDIAFFRRADGSAYNILRDFTPIARERPCTSLIRAEGPRELRAVVCEAIEQGIFHVALTPDYNAPHRDHFHLEIVPGEIKSFAR
jgi:hypothetical protein